MIDGHPGLRKAVGLGWPAAVVQRCCVHKLRNLERKAPKHTLAEIRADFHRIVYAESTAAARAAYTAFERTWTSRCPGVVRSLQEGGEELLTFFQFPKRQWKTLRTTNVIERLNEEFRRRVKTQGALPTEDAALVLLFGLVVSGQIRLRRLDGWRQQQREPVLMTSVCITPMVIGRAATVVAPGSPPGNCGTVQDGVAAMRPPVLRQKCVRFTR